MVVNQKITGRAQSMPLGLTLGTMTSLGCTFLLSGILGKLLDMEKIQWENIGYGVLVQLLVASFIGAIVAYRSIKRQRLIVCLAVGGLYFCSLLGITALFFGGQYQAVGVTAGVVLAGSGTAGILGLQNKDRRKGRVSIKRPR